MEIARSIDSMRTLRRDNDDGERIGFVPTMGALHRGHLSLVELARERGDVVVMSIFVNPTQFGPTEDFASYPRDEEKDLERAERAGVDIVFAPEVAEMYPNGASTRVSVGPLAATVEGEDRPGHFDGVCTVVAKFFNIVHPRRAYFGQKDAQQVAVVKKMVADLALPVDIVVGPTVRESDGLALSSRNAYLNPEERSRAPAVHAALQAGREVLRSEGADAAEKVMWELLVAARLQPSYARVVDPDTFGPLTDGPALLVIAAHLGTTRLIDNLAIPKEER